MYFDQLSGAESTQKLVKILLTTSSLVVRDTDLLLSASIIFYTTFNTNSYENIEDLLQANFANKLSIHLVLDNIRAWLKYCIYHFVALCFQLPNRPQNAVPQIKLSSYGGWKPYHLAHK